MNNNVENEIIIKKFKNIQQIQENGINTNTLGTLNNFKILINIFTNFSGFIFLFFYHYQIIQKLIKSLIM